MRNLALACAVVLVAGEARAAFVALSPTEGLRYDRSFGQPADQYTPFNPGPNAAIEAVNYKADLEMGGPRFNQFRAYALRFDVGSIPAGATITSATLDFGISNGYLPNRPFGISASLAAASGAVLGSRDVRTEFFPTPGTTLLTASFPAPPFPYPLPPPVSFDVTAVVRLLAGLGQDVAVTFFVLNANGAIRVNGPRISVTYETAHAPEPSSVLMVCLGGVALMAWRRRAASMIYKRNPQGTDMHP